LGPADVGPGFLRNTHWTQQTESRSSNFPTQFPRESIAQPGYGILSSGLKPLHAKTLIVEEWNLSWEAGTWEGTWGKRKCSAALLHWHHCTMFRFGFKTSMYSKRRTHRLRRHESPLPPFFGGCFRLVRDLLGIWQLNTMGRGNNNLFQKAEAVAFNFLGELLLWALNSAETYRNIKRSFNEGPQRFLRMKVGQLLSDPYNPGHGYARLHSFRRHDFSLTFPTNFAVW